MNQSMKKDRGSKGWQSFLSHSWWVLLFLLLGTIGYSQAIKKKKQESASLEYRIHEVQKIKESSLSQQEDLLLKLQSQSDPAWIELVLMRELGVVPDGFLKVHFAPKKEAVSSQE